MCKDNFTHLHLHTQYSLLDGANMVPDLVSHLKTHNMTSCAITDHGWMAGVIDFYKNCTKEGIKPLLGVEAYVTDNEDGLENEHKVRDNMHMVLIAKDAIGYSGLLQAISNGALNNFYYKPRIYKENLRALSGHVIATSACLGGVLAKKLSFVTDQYGRATEIRDEEKRISSDVDFYLDVFGDDFYLELQGWDSGDRFQPVYNQYLLEFGKQRKLPFVITADAHYLTLEDEKLHELLMAMQMKKTVEDYRENSEMLYGPHFYVAEPAEMLRRSQQMGCEEAFYNTQEIADKCDVQIELGKYQEPIFKIEETDDYQEFLRYKAKVLGPQIPVDACFQHSSIDKNHQNK